MIDAQKMVPVAPGVAPNRRLRWIVVGVVVAALAVAAAAAGAVAPLVPQVRTAVAESVQVTGEPLSHAFTGAAGEYVEGVWQVQNVGARGSEFDGMLRMDGPNAGRLAEALTVAYAEPSKAGMTWVPAGTLADPLSVQAACAQLPAANCVADVSAGRSEPVRVRVTMEHPELLPAHAAVDLHATFYVQYAPLR